MNDIFSIAVDATLENTNMCVQQLVPKIPRNEKYLGLHIIDM